MEMIDNFNKYWLHYQIKNNYMLCTYKSWNCGLGMTNNYSNNKTVSKSASFRIENGQPITITTW